MQLRLVRFGRYCKILFSLDWGTLASWAVGGEAFVDGLCSRKINRRDEESERRVVGVGSLRADERRSGRAWKRRFGEESRNEREGEREEKLVGEARVGFIELAEKLD